MNQTFHLDEDSIKRLQGRFVVLDGPDGSGKSTVGKQVAQRLREAGAALTACRDPGGTQIGDRIRSVLLDHDLTAMDPICEVMLFMASRAQLIAEVVKPALKRGDLALCDRFVSATCAYQVACGADLDQILELARQAVRDIWPDLTVILDVPVDIGFERISKHRAPNGDTTSVLDGMERRPRAFHETVRENFLSLCDRYPGPVAVVDATQPLEQVVDEVLGHIGRIGVN